VSEEDVRLRRQLRALAAVNRQLQAQLEGSGIRAVASPPGARAAAPDLLTGPVATGGVTSVRRGSVGSAWLEQLAAATAGDTPFLARRPDGATFLIDGAYRRRIKAGLLTAALEERLGPRREATDEEFEQWPEGPPVEALEAPSGPPFIVIGGERVPLRGLPLTHPVSAEAAAPFRPGRELSLSPGGLARARLRSSVSVRRWAQRTQRATARRGGVVPAATAFGQRQLRRVKRRLG
jgi:hypothetical protein